MITVPTSVVPILASSSLSGHCTTVANGNMNSFLATSQSGESQWTIVGRR